MFFFTESAINRKGFEYFIGSSCIREFCGVSHNHRCRFDSRTGCRVFSASEALNTILRLRLQYRRDLEAGDRWNLYRLVMFVFLNLVAHVQVPAMAVTRLAESSVQAINLGKDQT